MHESLFLTYHSIIWEVGGAAELLDMIPHVLPYPDRYLSL